MTAVLLDQGLPRSAVAGLRTQGWEIAHVGELDMSRASDQEILEYARQNGKTVVTLDADFHALLAVQVQKTPSVVRIRIEGLTGKDLVSLLQRIWPTIDPAVSQGALVTITENRIRIRNLPIG